eukprot:Phypoly_transcript_10428.p1 GENE.Phypoly_transcript_10428~~Phypoly_transcript_10428.p1  ORF type:complete len:330 (+),score=34.59 Phypoly_transcript_10428:93-992(+)
MDTLATKDELASVKGYFAEPMIREKVADHHGKKFSRQYVLKSICDAVKLVSPQKMDPVETVVLAEQLLENVVWSSCTADTLSCPVPMILLQLLDRLKESLHINHIATLGYTTTFSSDEELVPHLKNIYDELGAVLLPQDGSHASTFRRDIVRRIRVFLLGIINANTGADSYSRKAEMTKLRRNLLKCDSLGLPFLLLKFAETFGTELEMDCRGSVSLVGTGDQKQAIIKIGEIKYSGVAFPTAKAQLIKRMTLMKTVCTILFNVRYFVQMAYFFYFAGDLTESNVLDCGISFYKLKMNM